MLAYESARFLKCEKVVSTKNKDELNFVVLLILKKNE